MTNLGNVALDHCISCGEPSGVVLQTREGSDAFKGQKDVCTGGFCDKCETLMKENVTFVCNNCRGITVLKAGVLGLEAGSKFKIHHCIPCSEKEFNKHALHMFDTGDESKDFIMFEE